MTYINEGNAITLDEVLKIGLKHSRDHHSHAPLLLATLLSHNIPLPRVHLGVMG
jgi:hypothetical protein